MKKAACIFASCFCKYEYIQMLGFNESRGELFVPTIDFIPKYDILYSRKLTAYRLAFSDMKGVPILEY